MKAKISVVGSLNMDMVVTTKRMPRMGETVSGQDFFTIPGGKGANQAVGCARLGAEVSLIGAIGNDPFGERIVRSLERDGVKTEFIEPFEETPTGIASIIHTSEDNCIVVVPGANALCTSELVSRHTEEIKRQRVLLVQLEIPLEAVTRALTTAREAGVVTVLNPAPAKRISDETLRLVDYLTPNETEFEWLTGRAFSTEGELQRGMLEWEEQYSHKLVLTRGGKGCSYVVNGSMHTCPPPDVDVVDTTGAGDCFNAALSYGLAVGWGADKSITFAVRAASLSITKFGAQAGMPTMKEMNSAFN